MLDEKDNEILERRGERSKRNTQKTDKRLLDDRSEGDRMGKKVEEKEN